jgi:hypothetical protein
LQFVLFIFETTHLLSRHTCFRRRKAGGRNEGEPTIMEKIKMGAR